MDNLDPELAAAIASDPRYTQPLPPPEGVSLPEYAREQSKFMLTPFSKYYEERLPSDSTYDVSDRIIPTDDDAEITLRCLTPSGWNEDATYPVLVWIHGGGWMIGGLETDDNHLRTICVELQLVIVNVCYRLAPEHPFPTPFDDCYTALKWVAEKASSLGASLQKGFLIGGDSSGGNIAIAAALKARDDPFFSETGRTLTGQYLREPTAIHPLAYPDELKPYLLSYGQNEDTLLLNSERTLNSFKTYGGPPTDLRVSPLLALSHAGLPPAYIHVMDHDPLRDDGVVYEKVLREAGVQTRLIRYKGVLHGFHYTFPGISAAVRVDKDARDGLRWLLSLHKSL